MLVTMYNVLVNHLHPATKKQVIRTLTLFIATILVISGLADTSLLNTVLQQLQTDETSDAVVTDATLYIPEGFFLVERVVDGDTVVVRDEHGVEQRVRLIGVDAPESVHPTQTVECFGREASAALTAFLEGKLVTLLFDSTQGMLDQYDRTLAYIFLEDGTLVNEWLIVQGYAYEYTYNTAIPYQQQASFIRAEKTAQSTAQGLWAPGVCQHDAK